MATAGPIAFRVLGPVEVHDGLRVLDLGGPKQRALLADLVLHAGQVVPVSRLIDDLWGDASPREATHTIETYVSRLRATLRSSAADNLLVTRSPGYLLSAGPDQVDVLEFQRLRDEADAADSAGQTEQAAALFRSAVAIWRGPALADLADVPFVPSTAHQLEEQRLGVLEKVIATELRLGRHRELVPELESLTAAHPYRESFQAQLLLALYRSGRQADALARYRAIWRRMSDELGIEPTVELRRLEAQIQQQDPDLNLPVGAAAPAAIAPPVQPSMPDSEAQPERRRQPHRKSVWFAVAVAAVASITVPLVWSSSHPSAAVPPGGFGTLSASGRSVVAAGTLPSAPGALATGAGSVWVTSPEASAVYRLDAKSHALTQTVDVGAGAEGIIVAAGDAWVTNALDGTVSRIDVGTNRVVQTIGLGPHPTGIAFGARSLWVVDPVAQTLTRIDPRSGRLTRTTTLDHPPFAVAVGAGSVWVSSPSTDSILRVNPATGRQIDSITVGGGPRAVAFGFGDIWVANALDSTVSRIDPKRGAVAETIPTGEGPSALAIGRQQVWVANADAGSVFAIDPRRGQVTSRVSVGNSPVAVSVSEGRAWIAVRPSFVPTHRGGTLRVLSSAAFPSVDPAVGYPRVPPLFMEATYDTLVTFQRSGGGAGLQLVPDLALSVPQASADGRTYQFLLRPGLRYSDGSAVHPVDLRHGLERALRLNPAAGSFFSGLVGADKCKAGGSCDLSRGISVDAPAGSITFHLVHPDADFLFKLAFEFAAPVPAGTPDTDTGVHPIPGTGPYDIQHVVPGHEVDFVRNPNFQEWSAAAQPAGFPDRISMRFGLTPSQEVSAISRGQADWMADAPPDVAQLIAQRPGQLHINPLPGVAYIAFNTIAPPFNDRRVRRAVSFAADRTRAVAVFGGAASAQPTCQILPPGLAGYRAYCPFTVDPGSGGWRGPDLAAARKLVAASGTTGMRVTLWAHEGEERFAGYTLSVLRVLGYRTHLRIADDATFEANVNDSRRGVQATTGEWIADYPSASDFFDLFFRCSTFRLADPADTHSSAFYCRPGIDRLMDRADRLQTSNPTAAAQTWGVVDRRVTDDAPWVPFVAIRFPDFTSARTGDYQYNPAWGVLLDQLWVQ